MADVVVKEKPKTVSILQALAVMPSGGFGAPLKWDEFRAYLAANYGTNQEKDRNRRHTLRDELYRDGGVHEMRKVISKVFDDPKVRDLRLKWVEHARFNNVSKRIVNELSTVYSEPARRLVGEIDSDTDALDNADSTAAEPDSDNERYQDLLEAVRMDERMVEVNRLLNLHRALLVGFRVRQKPNGDREPVIDIATPANVRAIVHPNDPTEVLGWLIRVHYRTARPGLRVPAWVLWTDHESAQFTEDFTFVDGSYQEHGLGVCPWVPVTLGPPVPGFWPGEEGEDLTAAHLTIWFVNVLLEKESKSATKQTIITGDGTTLARGQSADSETPVEVADGQSISTVDMSMDLKQFRDTTDHILYGTAHNYGMSPAIIDHQGVQSAQARELMRLPLRELRRQQQVPLRRFEASFALVMAAVVKADLPKYAFDPTGWRIEFAESETPLDPLNEMMLFERQRAAGLTNTVDFLVSKHPGLTRDDAMALIERNVNIELARNVLMRPLQAIQGTLDAAIEGAAAGAKVDAAQPIDESGAAMPPKSGSKPGGGSAPPALPPPS